MYQIYVIQLFFSLWDWYLLKHFLQATQKGKFKTSVALTFYGHFNCFGWKTSLFQKIMKVISTLTFEVQSSQ